MDRFLTGSAHLELEAHVQLPRVLLGLAHVQVALEEVARQHLHRLVDVEHRLLPVRLLLVGRGREGHLLLAVAEVAVEPAHEAVHEAVQLDVQPEAAVEVQLAHLDRLQVDVVELEGVAEDVLVLDGVDDRLGQHPLLHALHADAVDGVPKALNDPCLTSFLW